MKEHDIQSLALSTWIGIVLLSATHGVVPLTIFLSISLLFTLVIYAATKSTP